MKKLTVMAACAALLLGGGVFVKSMYANNDVKQVMSIEVLAMTECEAEVHCGCGYYVKCYGKRKCESEYSWVICDGKESHCSQVFNWWNYTPGLGC